MTQVNEDENGEQNRGDAQNHENGFQNGNGLHGAGGDTDISTDSEIEPLLGLEKQSHAVRESTAGDVIPHKNGSARPVSSANLRKQRQRQLVDRTINQATVTHATSLDLSKKGLDMIPEQLLHLSELQCLYLSDNQLTILPDDFFGQLPSLEWLDLRDNQLISIPCSFLGRHKCLKNLLVENNKLHTLPLELGLLTTLTGLNIRGNPLEFPPLEVRNKGSRMVLTFLKAVLEAKLSGQPEPTDHTQFIQSVLGQLTGKDGFQVGNSVDSESSESENATHPGALKSSQQSSQHAMRVSDGDSLGGPVPLSAALHKPASYYQLKQIHMDRLKKTSSNHSPGQSGKKAARKPRRWVPGELVSGDVDMSGEGIEQNYIEQRRMLQMKDLREKQDLILHRRKEKELLKEWQNEGRRLQRNKHMDKLINGGIDYQPVTEHAPFAVDKEQMHMMTNEERIALDVRSKHESLRHTAMSPRSREEQEQARSVRDLELEQRIKQHTMMMKERRQRPKGTPQEEMEAAKQELEMAEQLQREIEQRRKDMENRFTAFVSEQVNAAYKPGMPPNQNYYQ